MQISTVSDDFQGWEGDVLVIGVFENNLKSQLIEIEALIDTPLGDALENQDFKGKIFDFANFQLIKKSPKKIVLIGLGEKEDVSLNALREAAAVGARASIGYPNKLGIIFPWDEFDKEKASQAVCEAVNLSLFKDERFLSDPQTRILPTHLELIGLPKSIEQTIQATKSICAGVKLARELVGAPANSLTPEELANTAKEISKEHNLQIKVLGRNECAQKGMGAYLAVSQGSDLEPKFIHLVYRSKDSIKKRLAIVGKGLTFDSGGYNLKVGASQIELMKFDMGGSGAVLGTARAIGELKPKNIEVHFIIAACENMINGSAIHPGDIVKASNGKTIEINNTDAEGRLTLADALVYASALNPESIIDLATLTGACVIALGNEIAGLWSEDENLAKSLLASSEESGEGLWRMPMKTSYKEGLKSLLADIKNTGPRAGGSITAALFLKEFVDKKISWAHLDIAGPVWSEKESGVNPAGATGYGVRTLVHWICKHSSN